MKKQLRIIQYGVGPIGQNITRYLVERPWIEIVGAVDIDGAKVGKDLADLAGLGRALGVTVTDQADRALLLADGRLRDSGPPAAVVEAYTRQVGVSAPRARGGTLRGMLRV